MRGSDKFTGPCLCGDPGCWKCYPSGGDYEFEIDDEPTLPPDYDELMRDVHPEPADILRGFWLHVLDIADLPATTRAGIGGMLDAHATDKGYGLITNQEVWA